MRNNYMFIAILLFVLYFQISDVVGTDGFVAYRSNTGTFGVNSPKIRFWNSSANSGNGSYGSEIELISTGSPVRNIVLKQSPINSKIVFVASTDNGFIHTYVCMKDCINSSNWNVSLNRSSVWAAAPATNSRRFYMNFESNSGDLILYYAVNSTNAAQDMAFFRLFNDNISFTGLPINFINDAGHAGDIQYSWMIGDGNPLTTSNEIIIAGFDSTNNDINSLVWNGTNFSAVNEISVSATATTGREALAVSYASDGTKGMVVGGNFTNGEFNSQYWNGSTWTIIAPFDVDSADANDIQWITSKDDPSTDDLMLTVIDSGSDLTSVYWNGASWLNVSNIDVGVDVITARVADFEWLSTGNTGRLIWDTDAAGTTLSSRICSPQCSGATQTFSTYSGTGAWLTLFRNPTVSEVVKFLGVRLNNAFDMGSFRYNGSALNYTNYGNDTITADTTVTTFESYNFDYVRDIRKPSITIISPNTSISLISQYLLYFNITSNEYILNATLNWNGTIYFMNGTDTNKNYSLTISSEGLYYYNITVFDLASNFNITQTFNVSVNFPPNITLVSPANNTLFNDTRNITFYYNVTDLSDDVDSCSLIIDGAFVMNATGPINETINNNFTYLFPAIGQHNWSIYCNDTINLNASSEVRNVTIDIRPIINYFNIDDGLVPSFEIVLNAGSFRAVNCTITATDPEGINNIVNATSRFYYYQNNTGDSDDNTTHYTDRNCTLSEDTGSNKTFICSLNVFYYANNGTWNCNATVFNSYNYGSSYNDSTTIQPLYAINITDGMNFGSAQSSTPTDNLSINLTNFGNMPINISLQGYALFIGDNVGMNCSDNTNITITNIKFSTNSSHIFNQKSSLNGSIQQLDIQIPKQTTTTPIINNTYWQISPDPGSINRICDGFVIFTAEAP